MLQNQARGSQRRETADPSDEELFQLAVAGTHEARSAAQALVARHGDASYSAVRARLGDLDEADSVALSAVVDAWDSAIARGPERPKGEPFSDYLYRHLYNACTTRLEHAGQGRSEETVLDGLFILERSGGSLITEMVRGKLFTVDLEMARQVWCELDHKTLTRFVLDLRRVEAVERPWSLLFALPLSFQRRYDKVVHLTNLQGEPLALALIYGQSPFVRRMCPQIFREAKEPPSRSGPRS